MPARVDAAVIGEFLAELDTGEPVVLVLDDFEEVSDERVLAGIAHLLKVAPPSFRLVGGVAARPAAASSIVCALPAARRARARLRSRSRPRRRAGCSPARASCSRARTSSRWSSRTEGWAGALALASLALRETDDPSRIVRDFAGDDRAVADYLASEVLGALPDDLCDFLVRTAIADEVCGELVDAMLDTHGGGPRSSPISSGATAS